jgi:hypothetical protein
MSSGFSLSVTKRDYINLINDSYKSYDFYLIIDCYKKLWRWPINLIIYCYKVFVWRHSTFQTFKPVFTFAQGHWGILKCISTISKLIKLLHFYLTFLEPEKK